MLPDARPRDAPKYYEPIAWPCGDRIQLPPRSDPLVLDVVALMEQRQTLREFTRELGLSTLGEFLWLACRSRSSRPSQFGPNQDSRPHPSAGALHPIHVFVAWGSEALHRYDPAEHALFEVPDSMLGAGNAMAAAQATLEVGKGWVLALIAEPGRTESKYEAPDSLVLRDAGVVLGYMSVVAAALGLAFCPLGKTGERMVTQGLPQAPGLRGVGLAVLGRS